MENLNKITDKERIESELKIRKDEFDEYMNYRKVQKEKINNMHSLFDLCIKILLLIGIFISIFMLFYSYLEDKQLKIFNIIQKPDKKSYRNYRLTSLRSASIAGITHYDSSGIRYFTSGVIVFNKLLFYKINGVNNVKIIINTITDRYRNGDISTSYLCTHDKPYTLKSELDLTEDRKLILMYCVHAIQILIDDGMVKDLMNYTKSNNKLLLIAVFVGALIGTPIGAIIMVIIMAFMK